MMLAKNRKFADSPLEGTGFEPSVPREKELPFETTLIDLEPLLLLGKQLFSPEGSGVRIPLPPPCGEPQLAIAFRDALAYAHVDLPAGNAL
jgi:hypothetical protein